KDLFYQGLLYLVYLQLDDHIIAIDFGMDDGEKIYLYIQAFDIACKNYSAGNLLVYYIIRQAQAHQYKMVDFMKGDESYKKDWGAVLSHNTTYLMYNRTLKSRLHNQIYRTYFGGELMKKPILNQYAEK